MEPHIQATWIQPIRMLGYFSQQKNRQSWTSIFNILLHIKNKQIKYLGSDVRYAYIYSGSVV